MQKNFNEVLKAREAAQAAHGNEGPRKLDDARRVKVLSPGRLVFKRFLRNRLAIVGSLILVAMFAFSFLGPLFYPYSQTQIFYKYDLLNINYASVTQRTSYAHYLPEGAQALPTVMAASLNSNIAAMEGDGLEAMELSDGYSLSRMGEGVYRLALSGREKVAELSSRTPVGLYNEKLKSVIYEAGQERDEAFLAALSEGVSAGNFDYDGARYAVEKGKIKFTYDVFREGGALVYEGEPLGEAFEAAVAQNMESGAFDLEGTGYVIQKDGGSAVVYRAVDGGTAAMVSTFVFDAFDTARAFSDGFKAAALEAMYRDGSFTFDGEDYAVAVENGEHILRDAQGGDVALLSTYAVRRYSGADTLPIDFKEAAVELVSGMQEKNVNSASFTFSIPQMNETGEYVRQEDGSLAYVDTEIAVQRKTGNYVFTCEQVTFMIDIFAAPSGQHAFGTDGDGMDILARMMYGGRISLMVGFVVVILENILGILLGGVAGYFGGWIDTMIMRLVDIFYCIPHMPILIILGSVFDEMQMDAYVRLVWMMVVLGVLGWATVARLVRGQILSLREQEFMVATEATGLKVRKRIFRHLVPNVMPQLIVTATTNLGSVILTESTLSFLGLGVKHPLATWGTMINSVASSAESMIKYTYIWIPVGLLICLTVIAFNFVGDGLRDAFDPKMK